jgi:hypothetical protein
MVVLTDLSILEKGFSNSNDSTKRAINNILFNENVKVCLNKNLISIIEKEITEVDYFQAFVRELYDNERIVNENSDAKLSFKEQFTEIALSSKTSFLIPLILIRDEEHFLNIPNLVIIGEANKKNKYWLAVELLTKNTCNVSFNDFSNDDEIKDFFDNIFTLPKFIREIKIFNREQDCKYLTKIKGSNIQYYTLLFGGKGNLHNHLLSKTELQKELGGKLKLFITGDRKIIHERKILFENLIVTLDNSLENITTAEPTWEIYITYDAEKSNAWSEKCTKFRVINN